MPPVTVVSMSKYAPASSVSTLLALVPSKLHSVFGPCSSAAAPELSHVPELQGQVQTTK